MSENRSTTVSTGFLQSVSNQGGVSDSNVSVRLIDPLLEEFGWPIRSPKDGFSVETNYEISDKGVFDYVLTERDEPKIVLEMTTDLSIDNRKMRVLDDLKRCLLVVTDGYQYRMHIKGAEQIEEIYNFKLQNVNDKGISVELLNLASVRSGLLDDSIEYYRKVRRDKVRMDSKDSELNQVLSDALVSNTEAVPEDISSRGAERMVKFISRRIDTMSFDLIVEMADEGRNRAGIELSFLDPGEIIIVSDTEEGIMDRKNKQKSIGELVTSKERDPKYVGFYIEESQCLSYISEIQEFELKYEKNQDEFANMVYNVELSRIQELSNDIVDEEGVFEGIFYTSLSDLSECEDLGELIEGDM